MSLLVKIEEDAVFPGALSQNGVATPRRHDLYPPVVPGGLGIEMDLTLGGARMPCEACEQHPPT